MPSSSSKPPTLQLSSQPHNPLNKRLEQLNAHMGSTNGNASESAFGPDVVPQGPEDVMFGLMAAYRRDQDPNKIDLGIGAYRDNNAKPWVLPVVKQVTCVSIARAHASKS